MSDILNVRLASKHLLTPELTLLLESAFSATDIISVDEKIQFITPYVDIDADGNIVALLKKHNLVAEEVYYDYLTNNPHNKPLRIRLHSYGENNEYSEFESVCPICGVGGLVLLDEPHNSAILDHSQEAYQRFENDMNKLLGPKPTEDDSTSQEESDRICDEYWNPYYDEQNKRFSCPTSFSLTSESCLKWIGSKGGPESHALCDQECYCHCHSSSCICPDPDKGVDPVALAIVCSIHGHVYTKTTTAGLTDVAG